MSAYDMLISKGMEQGLQEGIEKGLQEGLQQGIEKGLQQGIEKGLQQGIQKGAKIEKAKLVINAYQKGMDIGLIAELTELEIAEVQRIIDAL